MVKARQEVLQTEHHWLLIGWKLFSDFNHHGDKEIIYCMSLGLQTLCCIDLNTFFIIFLNISIWIYLEILEATLIFSHLIVELWPLHSLCVNPHTWVSCICDVLSVCSMLKLPSMSTFQCCCWGSLYVLWYACIDFIGGFLIIKKIVINMLLWKLFTRWTIC